MKKILQAFAAYLLLLPILLIGIWLFFLGREVLSSLLAVFFVGTSLTRNFQAGFADRMYVVFVGVGWMVLFVVAEEFLRRSVLKGTLIRTFLRFMGVLTLVVAVFDGIQLALLASLTEVTVTRWAILAVELILAAAFLFLGWAKRSPFYRVKVIPGILEP